MTLAGRGIPVACRVLLAIAVGSAALFAAPEEAAAHTPHDVIGDVVASPAYATDRTAFVISADRLLRSTDGGSNWTQVVRGIDRPLAARLAIAPSDKATMYLSVRATAIYRSRDQGLSWQRNPTPTALRSIADFAVSPVSPDVMFAAGATNGLFRTSDGGASWTQVGTFGQVTTVLYPEQSGRVLIGDSNGSVFISDDDGATWVQSSGTISGDMVTAMSATLAPPSPGSIFVGTKSGKVLRSTNRGASYSVVGTGLPAEQVTSIAISKNYGTDSTVWVSTWNNMYRSTNRGASFALKNTGLTKDSQATGTGDPQFRGLEAAIGSNGRQVVFVAGFDGLFRSDDNGNQWRQIQTLGEFVTGLAVSPDYDDDATVISTTYVKGAYLSRDRGATWKGAQVGLGAPLATKFAPIHRLHNVHFSPNYANDGTIFTATWTDIVKTTDRAVTWTTIPVEPGSKVLRQFVIAVSPAYASDGTVYAGTQQGDIFRSTSRGEPNTWSLVANVGSMIRSIVISPDFANEPVMYASAVTGVFKSVDAGQTWQQRGPSGSSMLAMSPNYGTDGTVFAGTVNGLFVTRDEGQSWTELVEPPFTTTTNVAAVGVSPGSAAEQVVLVSVFGAGLFRSSDGGNSFSEVGRSLIESNHNIADFQNPTSAPIQFSPFFAQDHTVFGMAQQHLVKSTDAGDTWQVLNLPPAADILRPPTVAASPMTAQVVEGRSGTTRVMRIPFDLSHPYASTVTVQWQTVDVPNNPAYATSASGDYITASGTLTFSPGATRQFADVVVRGDSLDENDESVLLSLRNATNATIGGFLGLGSGVIQDDDPPPTVVPGSATVTERDADTAVVSIPLTLSAPSGRTATIDWSTLDYQAVGGEDFVAAAGTVTFQPGELTKTVDVTVSGDVLDEDDEVLLISTFNPVNAKVGGFWGLGVATIQDNDPLPAVALGSASVAEGDADSVTLSIPVTLSVPSGRMVSIDWTTVDDTAVGGEDFAPASGTLTFLPGEVTKTIDVTVFGDTTVEPDEALLVAASNPTNATLDGAAASGSGQILNDDQEPE